MTSKHVFTYGSLMYAEVWRQVVSTDYSARAATLRDYRRFAVPGVTYPGMVATPGEQVTGLLYMDVRQDDLARLDEFEGGEYRRTALPVLLETGEVVTAEAYVWLDHARLSDAPWLPEAFRLREFIETYAPAGGDSGG
jgi:gamma-glutamylcyclotransferase (GGCT)/AIG2-like uncharacterized protein YtfP